MKRENAVPKVKGFDLDYYSRFGIWILVFGRDL
jgi:hypothetical protein